MTELLDAVDALTKPYRDTMRDTDGETITGVRPPRFAQLENAIRGSANSGSGAGGHASERNMIDFDALQRWRDIRDELNAEAVKLGAKVSKNPAVTLRRWYIAAEARTLTDTYSAEWERRLTSWAAWIDRKLDPPFQMEVNVPCPLCGKRRFVNDNNDEVNAVIAEVNARDLHTTYRIWCRACEQVRDGIHAVREWAYAIEHAEQEGSQTA